MLVLSVIDVRLLFRVRAAINDLFPLLGIVSHDLRQPLSSIRVCSEILLREGEALGADQKQEMLECISDSTAYMHQLVDNLLHSHAHSKVRVVHTRVLLHIAHKHAYMHQLVDNLLQLHAHS